MDLNLSPEQHALQASFAALFTRESTPLRVRAAEAAGWDQALWRRYVELEALGLGVPSDIGGADGGLLELALVAEEAGRRLAPIPVAETAAAVRLLARLRLKDLVDDVLTGSTIVSLATRPDLMADQPLVDGAIADAMVALDGTSLLFITRPDGLPRRQSANLAGLAMMRWPPGGEHRLLADGDAAAATFAAALDEIRVLRAAALLGLAEEAVVIGSDYVKVRHAFGQPLGMYQAVAHPFADAVASLDGARLLIHKACWALESAQPEGPTLAAMAFVFAAETAYQVTAHSLHIHGGYGFMEEYDIQLYYRRAKAWAVTFADPRRELLRVADRKFGPVASGRY